MKQRLTRDARTMAFFVKMESFKFSNCTPNIQANICYINITEALNSIIISSINYKIVSAVTGYFFKKHIFLISDGLFNELLNVHIH